MVWGHLSLNVATKNAPTIIPKWYSTFLKIVCTRTSFAFLCVLFQCVLQFSSVFSFVSCPLVAGGGRELRDVLGRALPRLEALRRGGRRVAAARAAGAHTARRGVRGDARGAR